MAGYVYIKKGPIKTKGLVNNKEGKHVSDNFLFQKKQQANVLKMKQLNWIDLYMMIKNANVF